jgi:uncharacterized protein YkwD
MKRDLLFSAVLTLLLGFCPPALAQHVDGRDGSSDERAPGARTASDKPARQPDAAAVVRGVVDRTNDFRKEHERGPATPDPQLTKASQSFADYMARTGKYGHTADGKQPADRAAAHGYAFCIVLENIAYQYSSAGFETAELAEGFFTGWRESPGHRKNMLDPDVQHTGVAVAQSPDGTWYAVQMFGRPKSAQVEFKLTNEGERAVRYAIGDERFTLEPGWTRTHTRCRPAEVTFRAAGAEAEAKPAKGKGAPKDEPPAGGTVRPAGGSHYVVTADAAGKVRVRPAEARQQPQPK